jgi:hypothetical protein
MLLVDLDAIGIVELAIQQSDQMTLVESVATQPPAFANVDQDLDGESYLPGFHQTVEMALTFNAVPLLIRSKY